MKVLTFDTETTGKWNFQAPPTSEVQPHLVQLACMLEDFDSGKVVSEIDLIVRPDGWEIPKEASDIHGIPQEMAEEFGLELSNVCFVFYDLVRRADIVVAHNIEFDQKIMTRSLAEAEVTAIPWEKRTLRCTMKAAVPFCKIPNKTRGGFKWPTLSETMLHFYGHGVEKAHNALYDTDACRQIHRALCNQGAFN